MTAERILRVGTVGRITTLDPLYAIDPAERDAIALLFRGLTRLGPAGTIQPDLAKRLGREQRRPDLDLRPSR